jgi:hypothetical protein
MSIATTATAIRYDGNGSTIDSYEIPFPFLETSHILAAVSEDGIAPPVSLNSADFSVTRNEDGQGGELVTVVAVDAPARLVIWRLVPIIQPTEFQLAGPFPSTSVETALDRLTMQCQQIYRQLLELAGEGDGFYVKAPTGSPEEIRDVKIWPNAVTGGAIVPNYTGQLGVRFDTQSIYISQSTDAGDWQEYRSRWQKEYKPVAEGVEVPANETVTLGFLFEDSAVKTIFISSAGGTDSEVQVSVFAGATLLGVLTIPDGSDWATMICIVPDTVFDQGTRLTAEIINASFGSGDREGLDVILECLNT